MDRVSKGGGVSGGGLLTFSNKLTLSSPSKFSMAGHEWIRDRRWYSNDDPRSFIPA